jgi:DNA invertase Pin-like site-specific DNA recombinase
MLTMFSAASELEKANIRARVASGREKRIREHQKIGTTPFGFKLDKDNKTLIPNGKEYEALQLIRQLRPSTSLPKIAAHLNDNGYLTQHGKTWSPGHVDSILRRKSI